ncbi:RNA polymerase factor sigma-54 [Pseudothermotoga thermarum]|uniref:Sigma-54 DNA-binding domain protein n=1 Tax=Pseudothermotoga thermarum DSM 5069 TaxID=688269 RepID=F7YYW2_9THEM|nr:sigma-54 DNA-binding domain-containing protein [Pseudothermotoga thermarum]AEH51156.1 sigma-54 DNA-binding domain protein [Pseudothermotoga thermarum DSM 5069]
MHQKLSIERIFIDPRQTFFKILELPYEALEEFVKNLPLGISLDRFEGLAENLPTGEKSLAEQIIEDLAFERLDDTTEKVAEYIAYNLDERGRMLVSISEVCEKFKVSEEVVLKAIQAIKNVGPDGVLDGEVKGFGQASSYVEPDIEIKKDYSVEVKDFNFTISSHQKDQFKLFAFFYEALNKRKEYLYELGKIVVETNKDFLEQRKLYPSKVKMCEAARRINLSLSAVSKLIKGKYIKTPVGIFPLKIFFGRKVEMDYLFGVMVKILRENPSITDKELSAILAKNGIFISRRTVNKYRNILVKNLSEKKGSNEMPFVFERKIRRKRGNKA